MGGCCGKESSGESFQGPGRVLGSAPPKPTSAAVPSPRVVGGPPRTLGGSSSTAGGGPGSPQASASSPSPDDARRKAAEAAQLRNQPKPTGKLGQQLRAEQNKTRVDTLKDASKGQLDERALEEQRKVMNYE